MCATEEQARRELAEGGFRGPFTLVDRRVSNGKPFDPARAK